jgi:glycosyltransferase involved in cell wall biosynthesis
MRKKIIVTGPALTQSGYGEHTRFLLRSLKTREDVFDIYLHNVNWGRTNWLFEDNEERRWMDFLLQKTVQYNQQGGQFDMSAQVTIPNEWKNLAPINIGVTAGIETTKVSPQWIEKSWGVDKIITISNHSKQVFENTSYEATNNETGEKFIARCTSPIDIVHYPVKNLDTVDLGIELDYDFNFLTVAQWGPRKNLENTVKWFIEEFKDKEVGLVVKTNFAKNCLLDKRLTTHKLRQLLAQSGERKCKVYLVHGYLSDEEINSLYTHPKIKALVSATHGEGFGLPLFEAAYNALPIVAPSWSGHVDFLYMPKKDKNGKIKNKAMFSKIDYTLAPVPQEAVWDSVLQADSMWCDVKEPSFKLKLKDMLDNVDRHKKRAKDLQKHVLDNFSEEQQYKTFVDSILNLVEAPKEDELVEFD